MAPPRGRSFRWIGPARRTGAAGALCLTLLLALGAASPSAAVPPDGVNAEDWFRAKPRTPAEAAALVKRVRAERRAALATTPRPLDPTTAASGPADGTWQEWAPPTRAYHTMVYDSRRDRLIVLGGEGKCAKVNLWTLALAGAPRWLPFEPVGGLPDFYHVAAAYDSAHDRVLAYVTALNAYSPSVWQLTLSGTPAWTEIATSGPVPPAGLDQAVALDEAGQRLFLDHHGGYGQTGEIWKLDLATTTWSFVISGEVEPDAYLSSAMVYDAARDQLIASTSAGLWRLQLGGTPQWSQLSESIFDDEGAELVLDRAGDAVIEVLKLGGVVAWPLSGAPRLDLSEGYAGYQNRSAAAAAYDPLRRRVIVHGGWDDRVWFTHSQTVAFDLATPGEWMDIGEFSGGPRIWHEAVVDPARDRVIVYGGYDWPPTPDRLIARPLGDPSAGVVALHPGYLGPSAYYGFSFTLDPPRDRVLLYGGSPIGGGAPKLDQLWSLSLSDPPVWTQLFPGHGPEARSFHTMLYDRSRDRMLLFGGWDESGNAAGVWELAFTPELRWRQLAVGGDDDGSRAGLASIDESAGGGWAIGSAYAYPPHVLRRMTITADSIGFTNVPQVGQPGDATRVYLLTFDPLRHRFVAFDRDYDGRAVTSGLWSVTVGAQAVWTWGSIPGLRPYNRDLQSTAYDAARDRVVIFGGYDESDHYFDEWWSLNWNRATPALASLVSAEVRDGRPRLLWQLSDADGSVFDVQRAVRDGAWLAIAARTPDGSARIEFEDRDVTPGTRVGYRLLARAPADAAPIGEAWLDVPARAEFAMRGATVNPVVGDLDVAFSLDRAGPVTLGVYDVGGRRVAARHLSVPAGAQTLRLAGRREIGAGVYFLRLDDGARVRSARVVLLR